MVSDVQRLLSGIRPIRVTLGRILYHPEAIMLGVHPEVALKPVLEAAQEATQKRTSGCGKLTGSMTTWKPHVTVAYSTTEQQAEPIISSLGKAVNARQVEIQSMNLVIQWGPERLWDWESVGTVSLGYSGNSGSD
jgi:hypothetical protein